jgi:prevent-host-death family protein
MCYMKASQVGVRELRQNLSVYLERVIAGESLEVTDRGHAVAMLAPLRHGESTLARLKREGRLIPATGDLLLARKPRGRASRWASRELQRERAERTR